MRLDDEAESRNMEDQRGAGGGRGFRIGGGRLIGIGTLVVALAAAYFFGIDPMLILSGGSTGQSGSYNTASRSRSNGRWTHVLSLR